MRFLSARKPSASFVLILLLTASGAEAKSNPDVEPASSILIDGSRWPAVADAGQSPAKGEILWRWSAVCAPARIESGTAPSCDAGRTVMIRVVDSEREPVAGARILAGTEKMISEVPEELLPHAITDTTGVASIRIALGAPVMIRVAGPRAATAWSEVALNARRAELRAGPASPLQLRIRGSDGRVVERARLELRPLDGDQRLHWSAAGKARFDVPHLPHAHVFRYSIWSESHAPATGVLTIGRAHPVILLDEGRSLSGRLLDADEAPLQGSFPRFFSSASPERTPSPEPSRPDPMAHLLSADSPPE